MTGRAGVNLEDAWVQVLGGQGVQIGRHIRQENKYIAQYIEHPTTAQSRQHVKQLVAFAVCMRKHGVPTFPDPNAQGGFIGSPGSS